MIVGFGLIVLMYLTVLTVTLSLAPAVALTYAVTPLFRKSHVKRLFAQLGTFALVWPAMMVVTVVVVLYGSSGNAGSGMKLWGMSYDDAVPLALKSVLLVPVVIVVGELSVFLVRRARRRRQVDDVADVFGDD